MYDIGQYYTERIKTLSEEIALLKGNSRKMIIWLLLSFGAMVLFVVSYFAWEGGILSLLLAVLSFTLYLFVRRKDTFYSESEARKSNISASR